MPFTLTPVSTTVSEGVGTVTFTITRSPTTGTETVFFSTIQNQGFTNSGDYTGRDTVAVTFAPGVSTQNITVSITNDTTPEGTETFGAIIENAAGTVLDSSTFTITDNDAAASTFTLTPVSTTVSEGVGSVTFTVTRSSSAGSETVFFSTVQNQGSTNSGDYTGRDTVAVNFAAGVTSQTITVNITNDATPEGTETFGAIIENAAGTVLDSSTFTITDNDAAASTFTLTPVSTTVSEAVGTVTFTITRSSSVGSETVFFSTIQNQGSTNSGDYTGRDTVAVNFAAGVTSQTITVSITNDTTPEGTETFGAIIENAGGTVLDSSTFTITDNDAAASTFTLTPVSTTVSEADGTITFTITRSSSVGAETVFFSTIQDQGFTNVGDYTGRDTVAVNFAAGVTSQTITVSITNDTTAEGTETFGAIIENAGGTVLDSSTFTITDNDGAGSTFTLTPESTTVSEGVGTITFTITRSSGVGSETVFFSTIQNQGSTNSGDYTGRDTVAVNFAAGVTTQTITVSVTNDTTAEGTETFGAIIETAGGTVLDSSTFTISDNDGANQAPSITGTTTVNQTLNQSFGFGSLISATDADGSIASYTFWDATPGAGFLTLNGVQIGGSSVTVSAANLGQVGYNTGSASGSNQIVIEAFDNQGADSNDLTMTINVAPAGGQSPTVTGSAVVNRVVNQSFNFTSLISASDPDGSVASYTFYDATPGAGYLTLNGVRIAGGSVTVSAANLGQVGYFTGSTPGSNQIVIEAFDNQGHDSNDFTMSINVAQSLNTAPTIEGQANVSFQVNQIISADQLFANVSDADGSVVSIRFWDSTPGAGHFAFDGAAITANYIDVGINDLARLTYVTGPSAGTNAIAIEATDNAGNTSSDLTVFINVVNGAAPASTYIPLSVNALAGTTPATIDPETNALLESLSQFSADTITWSLNALGALSTQGVDYGEILEILRTLDYNQLPAILSNTGSDALVAANFLGNIAEPISMAVDVWNAIETGINGYQENDPETGLYQGSLDLLMAMSSNATGVVFYGGTVFVLGAVGVAGLPAVAVGVGVGTAAALVVHVGNEYLLEPWLEENGLDTPLGALDWIQSLFADPGGLTDGGEARIGPSPLEADGTTPQWSYNADTGEFIVLDPSIQQALDTTAALLGLSEQVAASQNLHGDIGNEAMNDLLIGASGNDEISGLLGSDTLAGLGGDDVLSGGDGSDILAGGAGNDHLVGDGAGSSTITYQPAAQGADLWVTNVFSYSSNFGVDDGELRVGGWGDEYRALLRFDIAALGLTGPVAHATLRLYNLDFNDGSTTGLFLDLVNTTWDENYGWHDYTLSTTNLATLAAPGLGWYEIDITAAVNAWIANPSSNFGLQLRPTATNNNFVTFVSSDATGTLDPFRPTLVIDTGVSVPTGAADQLLGGAGNDTLDGGLGADLMTGGDGDDIYIVDNGGDVTSETSAAGGIDTVRTSLSRTLGANLENLVLTGAGATNGFGNALNNAITGNGAANQLNGFDGADSLDGGAGADNMFGGNGDDTYYVDNSGDQTTEVSALGGVDLVYSSVSRNLTANIENLTLTGLGNISGSGNGLNNVITGNSGANTLYGFDGNDRLDGGAGADTLFGANGNDVYVVDDAGDITVEGSPAGGVDTVESWISRNLNANFENMTLFGSATIAYGNVINNVLTGNALANALYGFEGNDTLDGGAGADSMFGADGNDTYIVDNAGDVTSEVSALGGTDTVMSSVERNLTANLENLVLTGNANINGAGNALNNVITGNSGVNTLFGLGGDDTLDGGLGADTLQGGPGADSYAFTTALGGGNVDNVVGFNVADDTIVLSNAVFTGLGAGVLAAGAFVIGAAAADSDDRIIYNSATGQLYFDADGNGAGAATLFATLSPGLALTSADFIVGGP